MRSSFTAMALALAFATVTALPAMAFTLDGLKTPGGGGEAKHTAPELDVDRAYSEQYHDEWEELEGLDREMNVLVLPSAPQVPGAEQGIVIDNTPPPMPASPDGISRPTTSPVAAFPSQAAIPSAAVVGQKVRPQAAIGQKVAPRAKPTAIAPRN